MLALAKRRELLRDSCPVELAVGPARSLYKKGRRAAKGAAIQPRGARRLGGRTRHQLGDRPGRQPLGSFGVATIGQDRCLMHVEREILNRLSFHGSRSFPPFGLWRFQRCRKGRAFDMR